MDLLKEAFSKVKQDIDKLNQELIFLKKELETMNVESRKFFEEFHSLKQELSSYFLDKKTSETTQTRFGQDVQSKTHINSDSANNDDLSTDKAIFKGLKHQNLPISTGNQGVSTDRQTDRQTDQQTEKTYENEFDQDFFEHIYERKKSQDPIKNAAEILESLDSLKKEIRLKFKRLTEQEISVFSALYQLDEEKGYADYKSLADLLNLTESSIRDYVRRLINKEVSVDKIKINNKTIHLKISQNLKKIASLQTILSLREL